MWVARPGVQMASLPKIVSTWNGECLIRLSFHFNLYVWSLLMPLTISGQTVTANLTLSRKIRSNGVNDLRHARDAKLDLVWNPKLSQIISFSINIEFSMLSATSTFDSQDELGASFGHLLDIHSNTQDVTVTDLWQYQCTSVIKVEGFPFPQT